MRVLVVSHGFPPAAEAGAEIYARTHAHALRALGHDVTVITRECAPGRPELAVRTSDDAGVRVAWINNTFRDVRTFSATYRNPAIDRIAEQVMDAFQPDAAHIHHLTGLSTTIVFALAARRIPRVMTLHDYWLICHRGQLLDADHRVCDGPEASSPPGCRGCVGVAGATPRAGFTAAAALRVVDAWLPGVSGGVRAAAGRLGQSFGDNESATRAARERFAHMQAVCGAITHFLAPSRHIRERFIQFGVAPDRITHAPYGFDHAPFTHLVRVPSPHLRIGFVGSLMVSKAPHVLLDAVARLPDTTATIDLIGPIRAYHGDAAYAARLMPRLAADGVRAHGPRTHDQIPDHLAALDVLVVPSIWAENSPLVIHEAFMAGVPVIASDIGGIPEIVHHEINGLLVTPGDVASLTRALARCIDEPDLLPRLRNHLPHVRDIADDVRQAVALYAAASPPQVKDVAAVVLNFRTPDDTLLATRSILASDTPPIEVIVVNNDTSVDPALDSHVARMGRAVRRVETGGNLGFSGGMNVGVREALSGGAGFALVANSDVVVPPDCIGRLLWALERHPGAGIAGPAVLSRCEPDRIESLGLSFAPATGRMRVGAAGSRVSDHDLSATTEVDAVSGCLMLIRREVFDAIGWFDEAYFFGFEDLDFCLRARGAGFATIVAGGARVYHEGGRSIGAASPRRLYFAARNHLRFAERTQAAAGASPAWRTWTIVGLNLAHAVRPGAGRLHARVAAVLRGTRDHRRGRFGPDPSDPS